MHGQNHIKSGMYIEKEKRNPNGKGDMFLCIRQWQWDDDGKWADGG